VQRWRNFSASLPFSLGVLVCDTKNMVILATMRHVALFEIRRPATFIRPEPSPESLQQGRFMFVQGLDILKFDKTAQIYGVS